MKVQFNNCFILTNYFAAACQQGSCKMPSGG